MIHEEFQQPSVWLLTGYIKEEEEPDVRMRRRRPYLAMFSPKAKSQKKQSWVDTWSTWTSLKSQAEKQITDVFFKFFERLHLCVFRFYETTLISKHTIDFF